ncbi:MAG: hypothetical protein DRP08_03315 [Candidatus Aenigmatarchaeota archaeon]|nr:MAG: hypothetical protein DRP08_03315 [Candidatus Aenigmarchaeota archaeon]
MIDLSFLIEVDKSNKKYLGLEGKDIELLRKYSDRILIHKEEIIKNVLSSLISDDEARGIIKKQAYQLRKLWNY